MLFGMNGGCALVLRGKLYVGGVSIARLDDNDFFVQVYDPEKDEWSRMPRSPMRLFAMAIVNQQLVLVGGASRGVLGFIGGSTWSTILAWEPASQAWTTPYPNMPTSRHSSAAVGYQQFLVVAGGYQMLSFLSAVEILNTATKQWHTAAKLPMACSTLTPAVVGDTLYLLGGCVGVTSPNEKMLSISLSALISDDTSQPARPHSDWEVTGSRLTWSTAVSLHGSLLAVGGKDVGTGCKSSAIHLYNPKTKGWTKIGDLPTALSQCSCAVLSSGELAVLGGSDEQDSSTNKAYFGTVKYE